MESKVTIKAALAFKMPFRGADITFWVVPMGMHLTAIAICLEDFDLTTVNSRYLWCGSMEWPGGWPIVAAFKGTPQPWHTVTV